MDDLTILLIVSAIIGALLVRSCLAALVVEPRSRPPAQAWSIGANDVASAFGTSVGSKALTINQALVVAAIFEFSGAFLMGSHVSSTLLRAPSLPAPRRRRRRSPSRAPQTPSNTASSTLTWYVARALRSCRDLLRDAVADRAGSCLLLLLFLLLQYENNPEQLMVGMAAAMVGAFSLILLATALCLPVSTTHSIGTHPVPLSLSLSLPVLTMPRWLVVQVGSLIGFSLAAKGWSSIKWKPVFVIVSSWVTRCTFPPPPRETHTHTYLPIPPHRATHARTVVAYFWFARARSLCVRIDVAP